MIVKCFQGHPRLVNALAKVYSKVSNRELNPQTEILVTSGAYEAIYAAIQGHTSKGDEWIIIEPFFDCYEPVVRTAGGVPRFIPLKPVNSLFFIFTLHLNLITQKKKIFSTCKKILS